MHTRQRFFALFVVLVLAAASAWAGNEPHTSYLGVDVQDVTAERVQALKLKSETGVEITMVDNDAPAGKAGLKEHDVILQFNGTNLESVEQLRRMIHEVPPGRTVALLISRDGSQQTVNVTLGDKTKVAAWPAMPAMPATPAPPAMPHPAPWPQIHIEMPEIYAMQSPGRVGLVVESLTPQLGAFFGVKSGDGLLVRSVEKGSPAEAAGFKAGDVIVKVDAQTVSDRNDWRSSLRNKSGKVPVVVVREKRERTLTLTLPERKQSSKDRVIVIPDEDISLIVDEVAELGPDVADLAMAEAQAELAKTKVKLRTSVAKAKEEMKQHREELKRQQKEMLQQQKEMMKEQKEMLKEQPDPDDDN